MIRILHVEDDEDNVYMLTQRLTRHGLEVSIAWDGPQDIGMTHWEKPDLILMDFGLPSPDGWVAARQPRPSPDTKDIPILPLSAYTIPGDRERALNTGCGDYDAKPMVFERMLAKISTLIRGRGLP